MIRASDANNSSLINTELVYAAPSPKINANNFISFGIGWLEFFALLENSNHAQINPNIMNTECAKNMSEVAAVACSETEVVKGSVAVKDGLTAFRYMNDGKAIPDETTAIPDATNIPNIIREFLIRVV